MDNTSITVLLSFLFCAIFSISLSAQNTVGLISYEPWNNSYDGYNLIYPHNQPHVYLLDNCGQIINSWEDEEDFKPGNTAYLTLDGNLIKAKRKSSEAFGFIYDTTGEAYVECRDWDNNLLWQFSYVTSEGRLHHDIELTPSGTVLMISWDHHSIEQAIAMGRDPQFMEQEGFSPDKIMEYDPNLDSIIWEWKAWDHLVQDVDPSIDNYGEIAANPRKININYENNFNRADWMHLNSIDYHPERDHIMINVPTFNEIWIIDHSTTTEEAATSTGGNSGYGGDLLWRWGNPAAYNKGTAGDQKLFFQHDALWSLEHLDENDSNQDLISIFNNKRTSSQSSVGIVDAPYNNTSGNYPIEEGQFLPNDFNFEWTHPEAELMYSTNMSSMQILPNGNYLICAGRQGYSFEYDASKDRIVWEYVTPIRSGFIESQGATINVGDNPTFRIRRYPTDYGGFVGKDLEPQSYLELSPNEQFCEDILPAQDIEILSLDVFPNPASDKLTLRSDKPFSMVKIIDIYGKEITASYTPREFTEIDISNLVKGIYFLIINNKYHQKFVKE